MWDPVTLHHEEVTYRAEVERLRLARLEMERVQKLGTERAETSRMAALHRVHQEEMSKKMQELEAAEAATSQTFARLRDAVLATRFAIACEMKLLQHPPSDHYMASRTVLRSPLISKAMCRLFRLVNR